MILFIRHKSPAKENHLLMTLLELFYRITDIWVRIKATICLKQHASKHFGKKKLMCTGGHLRSGCSLKMFKDFTKKMLLNEVLQ